MDEDQYNKIKQFWLKRAASDKFLWQDLTDLNCKLIEPYITSDSEILDLGAGDCRIALKLVEKCKSIKAVDYVPKNTNHPKIEYVQSNIIDFSDNNKYDLILLFGVMNYFSRDDSIKIYKQCKQLLKPKGILIIKHQCGRENDVLINTYSEDTKDYYISNYRWFKNEIIDIELTGLKVNAIDAYPPSYNKWPNTFFKAFIASA